MLLKGYRFNSFLKEYVGIYQIIRFTLEFIDETSNDCQIVCELPDHQKIYIPIELEDYDILANQLFQEGKLDLTKTDYVIFEVE